MRKSKYVARIGDVFGKWIVTSDIPDWKKGGYIHFQCRCECGTERLVAAGNLYNNVSTNCGCARYLNPAHNYAGVGDLSGKYFANLRRGAIARSLEFSVDIEQVYSLFDGKCKLSGLDISLNRDPSLQSASLDRIDSSIGYIEGNIQWIHRDINMMKRDLNQEYFISLCKSIGNMKIK